MAGMTRPRRPWTYSARRRVFLWAPLALVAGIGFTVTVEPLNGPPVVWALVLLVAALAATLDDHDNPPTNQQHRGE